METILQQLNAFGLDGFMGGIIVGILIGWNVLPQPEWSKPFTSWLQQKGTALWTLFTRKDLPPPPPPPATN